MNGGDSGGPSDSDPVSRTIEVLSHPLRRELLEWLVSNPRKTIHLEYLAELLMEGTESDRYPDKQQLMIQLRHIHVPILADHGAVEYDPRGNLLRYTPDEALESWLVKIQAWGE